MVINMARYIDASKAIDAIFKEFSYAYCNNCENDTDEDLCDDCHRKYQNWRASRNTIERTINKLPSAQPEQKWIPCSERLPDKEDIYLCCSTAQDIWILRYMMPYYFKEGAFIQFDGDYPEEFSDVIAWMPLP